MTADWVYGATFGAYLLCFALFYIILFFVISITTYMIKSMKTNKIFGTLLQKEQVMQDIDSCKKKRKNQ